MTGEISWIPSETGTYEILIAAYKGDYGLSFHQTRVAAGLCEGDFDDDGDVDGSDLAVFAAAFGTSSGEPEYNPDADFDGSGTIDETDLAVFAGDFGRTDCP